MSETMKSNQIDNDIIRRPYIAKGTHPIETGKYLISTNEIDRMYQTVIKWIENRIPGAIIYGRPRLGKTRAISYLINCLPQDFGEKMPIYHIRCRKHKNPNENFFFEDLLNAVGHSIILNGKSNMKRTRLLRFLVERADFSGNNKIIFFVDDAQRLVEIYYDWLMDLYNDLDHYGITLTTILVGQKELVHQRSAFIRGYRLQHSTEDLFQVFIDLRREYGLPQKVEIPMQYVTLTIEYALRRFGNNGLDLPSLEKAHWEEAINNSGYIQSELYQIN